MQVGVRKTEIVAPEWRLDATIGPIPGVEGAVAQKIENRTVDFVTSALGDEGDLASHVQAILRTERIRNHTIFPDTFDTERIFIGTGCASVVKIVHDGTVDGEEIGAHRRAVGAELDSIQRSGGDRKSVV